MAAGRPRDLTEQGGASGADGDAERRQLTVLFCDMVGSTRISEALDAEDWREMLRDYQRLVSGVVERFDGSVAQFLGDGVVAYFGHPVAHEDDAERAVRAALDVLSFVSERSVTFEDRYGQQLSVRIGIHTGPVVVGEVGEGERPQTLAVGATSNVAARVQAEAEPGTAVISAATLQLVRGIFVVHDLGRRELKGVATPVQLHQVLADTGASTRLDAASIDELTPFVARAEELERLLESWRRARDGAGQVVLLSGEAGIGKSRLLRVLRDQLAGEPHRWVECRASKFHGKTAFHPLSRLIEEHFDLDPDEPPEEQLSRLEAGLEDMGFGTAEVTSPFASLLGLPLVGENSPFAMAIDARRKLTLEALSKWLLALAGAEPVVLVVEDLHWLDSSTLDLLTLLIERVANERVLLLPTFRPSFEPPRVLGENGSHVNLEPLTDEQTDAMMLGITRGARLPDAVREQVVSKTDGIPLFVEEFTRSVLESGVLILRHDQYEETGPVPRFSVPATLQDSLMARLDRLGPAKNVAQLAAVLGREFPRELLTEVASDAESLERHLASLVGAGIIQGAGDTAEASYSFKHALIQETAYHSLLKSTRRALHGKVAEAVETHFAASAAAEPERLAWHYEEAGLAGKAARYYQSASEQAQQRSAVAESIQHLRRALELLDTLPESQERDTQELGVQIELAKAIVALDGWSSPDAEKAYRRAKDLCDSIGELPQEFQVIRGLVIYYTAKSELRTANELARRMVEIAEQSGEPDLLVSTHYQRGILRYYDGQPAAAESFFQKAIDLHAPADHEHLMRLHGEDLRAVAPAWMAWAQWLLGRPDEALATCRRAQVLAEESGHQYSLAYVFLYTSVLCIMRRDTDLVREMAEQCIAIAERHGFSFLLHEGKLMVAWMKLQEAVEGPAKQAALAEFQACVNDVSGTGILANAPVMTGFLADAYHGAGQHPMALAILEGGLAISLTTGQSQWDAELHRLKGEFILGTQPDSDEADPLFRKAIEIAEAGGALSLQLRAAVSLARLLARRGDAEQARALVEPVYARFVEGYDRPDLVDAREFLEA